MPEKLGEHKSCISKWLRRKRDCSCLILSCQVCTQGDGGLSEWQVLVAECGRALSNRETQNGRIKLPWLEKERYVMSQSLSPDDKHLGLETDLYELTMAAGYHVCGMADERVTF